MANNPAPRQPGPDPSAPARLTPYELVFGPENFESRVFPRIATEAEERSVDALHQDRFQLLASAGDAVRDVIPADAPPDAFEQYRAILYQAFNFWRYGKRLYLLEPAVARYLVEATPQLTGWEFVLPYPSLYIQLPPNLFWGSISPGTTPEPVDGFFVTAATAVDALGQPYQHVSVLVVLGIRRDRAGFSVIPFDTEAGAGIAEVWASAAGRDDGTDFQNVLPGGEIAGLYSILTTDEVLKLLGRTAWYIDQNPAEITAESAPERGRAEMAEAPPISRVAYFRVSLGREGSGD